MTEMLAGVLGGFGLFVFGMWLLTENLKKLASRRLRRVAQRWAATPHTALLWGLLAGGVSQSMAALTFIVVSILRSRLIGMKAALAAMLGGSVGTVALVLIASFDVKTLSICVLGVAGAAAVSERLSRYRPFAASFLGGAMIIFALVMLRESAAPLANEPWFREVMVGTGKSLLLAFAVGALLTFLVQSSSAVSVLGFGMAAAGAVSVDHAMMIAYGSCMGSSAIIYVLSASLTGRSRQIAMYWVFYNVLLCAVGVPVLYCEVYLGIPLTKALIAATGLDLPQQLALFFVIISVFLVPFMLAALNVSVGILERLWPTSRIDSLSQMRFIYDHASVDMDTALVLADLEQRRAFAMLSQYFDLVRQKKDVAPLRETSRMVLSEIDQFLTDLQDLHPLQSVEKRNTILSRQKLLFWLDDATAAMCTALLDLGGRPVLEEFRANLCEGIDSVFLSLADAMDADDRLSWELASRLTESRVELMRSIRRRYQDMNPPLQTHEMKTVTLVVNGVENIFFLLSKVEAEFNA